MEDVVLLSRIQFALTIMFHYIFPPLSIGLGLFMVLVEGIFYFTKDPRYKVMAKFWTKIFAVNFALGVASGIVMEFQFGTNWSTYSRYVGDVFGSALAAEGIFAFFLESGFLAILVFGWDRVSDRMHFFSTLMVCLGAIFSSVWITVANSWQQTPTGHHIVGEGLAARAEILDFWAMVFNPSSIPRLIHVWIGAGILGALFVLSISSFYVLKNRHSVFAKQNFFLALVMGLFFALLAPITGHYQAVVVAEHQPAKLAAFEGSFETRESTPIHLFGIPNSAEERVDYSVEIPGLLSFLVHGDFKTPVTGLDQFDKEDRPPVGIPFSSFHLMVALGLFFILILGLGMLYSVRGSLFQKTWLLRIYVFAVLGGFAANELGWIAAEVGRQPWVVYNLLRTSEGVSKVVQANAVLGSIIGFSIVYLLLFFVWVFVLNEKIQHGPDPVENGFQGKKGKSFLEYLERVSGTKFSLTGSASSPTEGGAK